MLTFPQRTTRTALAALIGLAMVAAPDATRAQDGPKSGQHLGHGAPAATGPVPLYDNLGAHSYRVTASTEAQRYFDQGIRMYWGFNHLEAIRSFTEAERVDPSCGMCAWGIALALGPNINAPMDPSANEAALAAVARAQSRASALSPRERALIGALAARYAAKADRATLDSAYSRAMAAVVAQDSNDLEARSLYAESIMDLSPWNYWNADGTGRPQTAEALQQLEFAMKANAQHPGACHLFIHAVEAQHPRRALECAEKLAAMAPGAGHLVHMPAHIYIRVGRYKDAVTANKHAVHADETLMEGPMAQANVGYKSGYYSHNHHFLTFAASMMGNGALAISHARDAVRAIDPELAALVSTIDATTAMPYLTLVTFGKWDEILTTPLPKADARLATGMAFYARGVAFAEKRRWAEANAARDTVLAVLKAHAANENKVALQIAAHALNGEIAMRRRLYSEAVREFTAATALEDGLPYLEPPTWYYPVRQSLGKAYLLWEKPREAERVYREDLAKFPENGWSLFGLARALEKQGRMVESKAAHDRYRRAFSGADVALTASRF